MCKTEKAKKLNGENINVIAEFLVEDFKFCRSYFSVVSKMTYEDKKKYEATFAFHKNKIQELAKKINVQIKEFDNCEYDEGLPVTPLNADEFITTDNLIVQQTIEPAILSGNGETIKQGTVILSEKQK